jgi:hypothetical protein
MRVPWEIFIHILEYADPGTVRRSLCCTSWTSRLCPTHHAWLIPYIQREMKVLEPKVRTLSTSCMKERVLSCLFMAYSLQWNKLCNPKSIPSSSPLTLSVSSYTLREWNFLFPLLRFLFFMRKEIHLEPKRNLLGFLELEEEEKCSAKCATYIYYWTRRMSLPRAFFIVKKE